MESWGVLCKYINIADAINKLLPMKNLFIGVVLVPHICLNYCPSPDASF